MMMAKLRAATAEMLLGPEEAEGEQKKKPGLIRSGTRIFEMTNQGAKARGGASGRFSLRRLQAKQMEKQKAGGATAPPPYALPFPDKTDKKKKAGKKEPIRPVAIEVASTSSTADSSSIEIEAQLGLASTSTEALITTDARV